MHKSLEYRRRLDLENDINCSIVIQVRRSKKKWTSIIGSYRQWTGMSPTCPFNGRSRQEGLLRFEKLIDLYEKVISEGHDTVIGGDLNIDRLKENNPLTDMTSSC